MNRTVRKSIDQAINESGLKKKYVAEKLGISPQYLITILKHPENLTVERACTLCVILDCKFYELDFNVNDPSFCLPN